MYTGKRIIYFDLETSAIPDSGVFDVDTIHCIGIKINSEPTLMYTSRFLPLSNYGGILYSSRKWKTVEDMLMINEVQKYVRMISRQ